MKMKSVMGTCLFGFILISGGAQKPVLRQGISVEMPVASHALDLRAADGQNATVVAISADGKVFVGVEPTEATALDRLTERTVYVNADSRVPYQKVLAVLDALRGKSVVLLSEPPDNAARRGYTPPYVTKLIVSR